MKSFKTHIFPATRIATLDICTIGLKKHHIAAFAEADVTESRRKIREFRKQKATISFFAWLIKVISMALKEHPSIAGYLKGKRTLVVFDDINVSVAVEKDVNESKVPIPLIIEKADKITIEAITGQISEAKGKSLTEKDIVLHNKSNRFEQLYFMLPGFVRRMFWRYMVTHPHYAFRKMGNVAITSIGGLGGINAWFTPISVHPVCFGIGDIIKKPVVVNDQVEIREILNISILLDHDVADGMEMARFLKKLARYIETGACLELSADH